MNRYNAPATFNRSVMAVALLAMTSYGSLSYATEYYVSPRGNDSNSGTLNRPWKTIAKASSLAGPGDIITIRRGTYAERVIPARSGTPGKFITYRAYPKEKVTIDGSKINLPYWSGLVDVSNKSYIKIAGLSVIDSSQAGIFGHEANNIIVSKCSTYNTDSSGIGMHFGSNITVDWNEVVLANTHGNQENITINSIANFQVSNNHVHDGGKSSSGGEGIDAKGNSYNGKIYGNKVHHINRVGIYVDSYDGTLSNVEVYNNTVYSNINSGIQIGNEAGGFLENVRVFNNVVFKNEWSGIHLWGGGVPGKAHAMADVYILNNTVAKNGWTEWGSGISTDNPDIANLVVRNNIVSQNTGLQIQIDQGLVTKNYIVENNLIDNSNRKWQLQGSEDKLGAHAVNASPQFVDFENDNFNLAANSPAIGKGLEADNPGFDFNFRSHANNQSIDLGAFQH